MVTQTLEATMDMNRIEKQHRTVTTYVYENNDHRRLAVRINPDNGLWTVYGEYRRHTYGSTAGGWGTVYRWTMDEVYTQHLRRNEAEYAARCLYREIVK